MLGMTAPWLDSKTPVGPPASASPTLGNLLYAAAVTGGWSGLLCLLVYVIGRLAGVPFAMVTRSGAEPTVVPWLVVLLVPLVAAVVDGGPAENRGSRNSVQASR